ncbi:MAG: histidine kinase [Candidatus Handelsmanbacteria bacterium RIFCSPLOWO2_12_FULL_64_10]|uniref:histidine kinase n=1 Tax=Handelsmanbacteria sp. (strain RIFCSPLOWO2_12_FULL_64_10) TaxID=1817868 RepID=A0A1F6CYS9_HANXR|nr:MAG: histidine kinase [Candidatus Handelsmanbacteria bacterium RIFCSPLOWO2_12_FULL_64_10]
MVSERFRAQCIVRALLLSATITLWVYLFFETSYYATLLIVGGIAVYQVYALIHYVEKTNRDLDRFLQAIRGADFSQTFTGKGLGASFDALKAAFNEVLNEFRRARAEKEEHYRYLQTVVQHVGIGLIAFQPDGDVELMNNAARRLLRVGSPLRNIQSLEPFSKPLIDTLLRLKPGEKALVRVEDHGELLHLAIYATEFRLRERNFILVSIQNIQSELEEKEMEAWQNLIRVLTHEIMNSVTPIASLASTAHDLLTDRSDDQEAGEQGETIRDVRDAVRTIQRRSYGLLHFVDAYRKLTRIPKPNFQIFPVSELFGRAEQLMRSEMENRTIRFRARIEPKSLELTADPELIEQVLINLLLNAVQALEGRPGAAIELTSRMDERGRVVISVKDNGPGILDEVQERIFIPFFTTRRDGSGIGLSLSRQIMRLHRGTISVQSRPNAETIFTLRF